jgi:hypothetical protein
VQLRGVGADVLRQDVADREAVLGEADGGREHLLEGQRAEAAVRLEQPRHCAGYGDDAHVLRTVRWRGRAGERRRALRRVEVEEVRLLLVLLPYQHHAAAADAGHLRLDDADGERGRHRGIDGVAARTQHGDAGVAGEGVGGRHCAVRRDDALRRVRPCGE